MHRQEQGLRATRLRRLHNPGDPLVLVNVWDVASARVVAALPVTQAIATASWSIAAAHGYPDGGAIPLDLVLATSRRIVEAVALPVTVDFEKGYAATPAGVRNNVARLIETGAAGLNIEDSIGGDEGARFSIDAAAARVAAARDAGTDAGIPMVINARTDTLAGGGTGEEAVARGRAYLDAGADCIFVLGAIGPRLNEIVAGIAGPVAVLAGGGDPSVPELAACGVARVSFGPGPMGVAHAALARLVDTVVSGQPLPDDLGDRRGGTPA